MVTLSIRKRGTPAGSFMFRLPRVRRERPGRRAAEQRDVQNRGRHAINVVTVLTRPSVGYAKFFGRIPSAGFYKTSLTPVVVRWTRPTVRSSEVGANESRHDHPARAAGRRAAARARAHGHLQRAGGRREPL